MSNKLRVYFHTVEPVHNFYREQFHNPPKGVEYVPGTPLLLRTGKNENTQDLLEQRNFAKEFRRKALKLVDPFAALKLPVVKPLFPKNIDLIHSAQMLIASNTPWVVDFEELSVFAQYHPDRLKSLLFKGALRKVMRQDKCRKLLPWTKAAEKGLQNYFKGEKWAEGKSEVVYPTVSAKGKITRKEKGAVKFFFIGKMFYFKGGMDALHAFMEVRKKVDAELTIISKIPEDVKRKYSGIGGLHLIESGSGVSNAFVENTYREADAFVYPTHMDTLGFVALEAMSYGLPVVSTTQFAMPEMVSNGKSGILVQNPYSDHKNYVKAYPPFGETAHPLFPQMRNPPKAYLKELSKAMLFLAEDPKARRKMGAAGKEEIESGKFSAKKRGKQLERIYEEAASS